MGSLYFFVFFISTVFDFALAKLIYKHSVQKKSA